MAYNTAINTRYGAIHADGIPVDSYPPDAAIQVLSIVAELGNLHFILVALSLMALIRYRSIRLSPRILAASESAGTRSLAQARPRW